VVATTVSGQLSLYRPGGGLSPFARGPNGYDTTSGEAYIDLGSSRRLGYADCSFGRDVVYALDQSATPGVVRIGRRGTVSRFANIPPGNVPTAITFDRVGRFGHRLLVAASSGGRIKVFGFDCQGHDRIFVRGGPPVEGGMRVAPRGFGRFGGQLIMPDELSGNVYAASPSGVIRLVINPGTPAGPDTGIESLGFVPHSFDRRPFAAYVASAHTDGILGPGSAGIFSLGTSALRQMRLRPGDLLGASETNRSTVAIHCAARCSARLVARAPAQPHIEGHIVFAPAG
jgi:hypothetical protein